MKLLCLISGGIDSPVAGYLMLKKRYDVEFLHLNIGTKSDSKVKKILQQLKKKTKKKLKLHLINHTSFLKKASRSSKYTCVLCKREMLRKAEKLAKKINAKAIITGDSLGQVASQTLDNMYVETKAVSLPVIRPLIGLNKNKIIDVARKIGTFDTSISEGSCCEFVPKKPETRARLKQIITEEEKLK